MKSLLMILITSMSAQVFAAGAMEYSCTGVSRSPRAAIEFSVVYSDYERSAGFTNQSVTVTKFGDHDVSSPLSFQMFGANKKNNCTLSSGDEIYVDSKISGFKMSPANKGQEGEVTTFKMSCPTFVLDVVAVCTQTF